MTDLQELLPGATESDGLVQAARAEDADAFARSVARGLSDDPRWLDCRYLYDDEGSRLFVEITKQPEYYPTRTEASILARHARRMRELTGPVTLVELGSGYSAKTQHLLEAYATGGAPQRYVAVDVSDGALAEARASIAERFEHVEFGGVHGTYADALLLFPQLSPQMVVFLGSSVGNLNSTEAAAFWSDVTRSLPVGDFFLLGVDLVKQRAVLEAAYADAAGVTARFTRNYFVRMNRELGTEIDLDAVQHVATWNPTLERIEIRARFTRDQDIRLPSLGRSFHLRAGETVLTEISRKYRIPKITADLAWHGLRTVRVFTDPNEWFALLLLQNDGPREGVSE